MSENIINALVFIQNWGDKTQLLKELNNNKHVVSIFHIMGRYSYLIDANFDNKTQLEAWINKFKALELASGIPAVRDMQTQKILNVYKQKSSFTLEDYDNMKEKFHFFVIIDTPHHSEDLLKLMQNEDIVHSIVHIQGNNSLIAEIITPTHELYTSLLRKIPAIQSINRLNILEVVHVNKYRNQILDDVGNLVYPAEDIRELYTL